MSRLIMSRLIWIYTVCCVDVWNNKVLRSGAGCHFRIPIVTSVNWSEMDSHVTANSQVYLADCRQPTPELLAEIAGSEKAIAAIELHKEKTEGVSLSAYPSDVDLETDDGAGNIDLDDQDDTDDDDDETLQVYKQAPMNVTDYDKVRFLSKETVLIIGGETKGISNQARKFAYNNYGQFITLPMLAGVESLNCAVAGSVILYEMGKHFRQNKNA